MSEVTYSRYEVRQLGIRPQSAKETIVAECVGTFEDEMEVKVVTKNCRGVPQKVRPRGTGSGTITTSLHMPIRMYKAMFAMERDDLAKGVMGYGRKNLHQPFCLTADVYDEDDNEMLVAYPNCIMQTGPNSSIENGADEIAEAEVEISIMPDEQGYGKYEALVSEVAEEEIKKKWLSDFTPELVKKVPETPPDPPTAAAEDSQTQAYGKTVSELQDNIQIEGTSITGTLHYIKDYQEFSSNAEEQKGNYIALKIEYPEDVTMKAEVINGTAGEITLPAGDHQLVCRIKEKTQKIKLTAVKGEQTATTTYDLSGLTLDPES